MYLNLCCLDFLPDKQTLRQCYEFYAYDLLPEDQVNDFFQEKLFKKEEELNKKEHTHTTERVYIEMICQRLQQGFQLILQPKAEMLSTLDDQSHDKCMYILSIGRIYHELLLRESKITITYYHPRHVSIAKNIKYCYRIRTPDNDTYGISWVEFAGERLENYKWNYLDNYICLRADSDYQLIDSLKFWRFRLLVLPTMHSITKVIIEKYTKCEERFDCDLYHVFTSEEKRDHQAAFLKLLEVFNRIKNTHSKHVVNMLRNDSSSRAPNRRNSTTPNTCFAGLKKLDSLNYTRHSQPAESLLSTISETSSRMEKMAMKVDSEEGEHTSQLKIIEKLRK